MATGAYLHVGVAELVLAQLVMLLEDLAQAHSVDLRIAPAPLRLDHQVVHLQSEVRRHGCHPVFRIFLHANGQMWTPDSDSTVICLEPTHHTNPNCSDTWVERQGHDEDASSL